MADLRELPKLVQSLPDEWENNARAFASSTLTAATGTIGEATQSRSKAAPKFFVPEPPEDNSND
jgi:hypothetical protein